MNTLQPTPSSLEQQPRAPAPWWRRWQARLAQAWRQAGISADQRYVGNATDLADLERRLDALTRGDMLR